jgi:phage shock protein C
MASQKLTKSTTNRMIAGVCGGIGEYLDVDPTIVRVLYVVISLFSAGFPGLIVYIALALIMPER